MVVIGIDFGTTSTRVAVFKDKGIEVILNEYGNRCTPSYVAFTNTQQLIGESALADDEALAPQNTVYGVKRIIGRKFNDNSMKNYISNLPFQIVDSNDNLAISVEYMGVRRTVELEEITSMILGKIKAISQSYLGVDVEKCVITVPAQFNSFQRQAVTKAASIAGLNVLEIMNETTAALFTFGLYRSMSNERKVLIFHLGGGMCNATITTIGRNSRHEIKAIAGSYLLGINNFINTLAEFFARDFVDINGIDIRGNRKVLIQFKKAAHRAMIQFASCTEETIYIDSVCDGKSYFKKITRAHFEELCSDLFERTMSYVQAVLRRAKLQTSDIYFVILMGGGTRLLKINNMMNDQFDGRILTAPMPEEVVVCGAAIRASALNDKP